MRPSTLYWFLLLSVPLVAASPPATEDGYDLWLRYRPDPRKPRCDAIMGAP